MAGTCEPRVGGNELSYGEACEQPIHHHLTVAFPDCEQLHASTTTCLESVHKLV